MKELIHQESGTSNLQQLISIPEPLLSKPVLRIQLPQWDLIIMPFIMVMLRSTLNIFQFNITLKMLQIHTPLRSNQLFVIKWTIYWNSSTLNMMTIFWILTSKFFRIDCWLPLLQNVIQSLLCCFIIMAYRMYQSQIPCLIFLCLSQPGPLWNWIVETWDMTK